ncbi:pilin [Thiocapsa rosea]
MIVVAIIGILAAVAVPAYRDYAIRAKVSEVLLEVGKVKTDLSLFYSDHGRFPVGPDADVGTDERKQFKISPEDKHPSIRVLAVHGVGACNRKAGCPKTRMEVQLRRSVYNGIGGDANSQLRLEGHGGPSGGVVTWLCGPRDVQPLRLEWLPATCRHPPT